MVLADNSSAHITLAGGGHAHLAVLRDWAARPLSQAQCTLITPSRYSVYSGMLPGWMAGQYQERDLLIDLEPLAARAGARLIHDEITALNADMRQLTLASGEALSADIISLATGGVSDARAFAPLGERLIALRPISTFMARWQALCHALADGANGADCAPIQLAVIGGGAAGFELALAAKARLSALSPGSSVSIICPKHGFLRGHSARVQRRARAALRAYGVQRYAGEAQADDDGTLLVGTARLAPDYAILAAGSAAPAWPRRSGLACSAEGFVSITPTLQSLSHPAIFAAGDISARLDRPLARSGVHAVKAGPVLAHNIRAFLGGAPLTAYRPHAHSLSLLSLGSGSAILSYGSLGLEGRLLALLKDQIDRRFIARHHN